MVELAKNLPATIDKLKSTVEGLAELLDSNDVAKAVANVMKRAKVCKAENGGSFQHLLKRSNNREFGDV